MQKQVSYAEAKKTKYPEQVVVVIAKDREARPNPISVSWMMSVSSEPPMLAIAIHKTHYSVEAITHSRSFTIAYPSEAMQEETLAFGKESGRDVDKLEKHPCATEPTKEIDSVLLSDAVANFECELESYMPTGDHMLYVGRVLAAYVNKDPLKRLYVTGPDYQMGGITPKQ